MESEEQITELLDKELPLTVVLWNDEFHSFPDVIDVTMTALDCDEDEAQQVAQIVDVIGLKVVEKSTDPKVLRESAKTFRSIGLSTSFLSPGIRLTLKFPLQLPFIRCQTRCHYPP